MQKTAYEMRISDWSSDVCSADLWSLAHERARMRRSEVLGTSLVPQEPADDEIADDDAVWLAFATDGAAETVVEPLRGAMRFPIGWLSRLRDRAEPVYEDDPLPRLDALRDLPVPVQVGFEGPRLRSEEHTSELQSLMRISY